MRASRENEFPVEQPNRPPNTLASLPRGVSISARRTQTQRPRDTRPVRSTSEAYPKTRPASTRKRPCECRQHANTIVPEPGNPQALNRYSYSLSNPIKYTDSSGHFPDALLDLAFIAYDLHQIYHEGWTTENTVAFVVDVAALFIPVATGGGPATRLAFAGGRALTQAAVHVPQEVRALQAGIKVVQTMQGEQLPLPGFPDSGSNQSGSSGWEEAEDYVSKQLGISRNTKGIELKADYFTSKTKTRVPDFDPRLTPGKIVEVKSGNKVWLRGNLADFIEYARRNSLKVELWYRKGAWLDPALRKLAEGDYPILILKEIVDQ